MCLPQLSRLVSTKLKLNLIDFERYMAIIGISSMKDSEKYYCTPFRIYSPLPIFSCFKYAYCSFRTRSIISPIFAFNTVHILINTPMDTSSSLRSFVIVFGAIPAARRRSALLIFLSIRSFQSLLYEMAIA